MREIKHRYEVRPRKDKRGVDLSPDALPFGRLWYGEPNAVSNAVGDAQHYSRSHHAVIRVYYDAGNVMKRPSTRAISKNRSTAHVTNSKNLEELAYHDT